jgi:hypothetical protein
MYCSVKDFATLYAACVTVISSLRIYCCFILLSYPLLIKVSTAQSV